MDKVKSLITYREYGYTPHAFYDYRFIVGRDNQCRMTFVMNSADQKLCERTKSVALSEDEVRAVYKLCDAACHHFSKKKDRVGSESFSVIFNDSKEFQEDVGMQKRMDQVMRFIRGNHPEELGEETVGQIYDSMVTRMGINTAAESPVTK